MIFSLNINVLLIKNSTLSYKSNFWNFWKSRFKWFLKIKLISLTKLDSIKSCFLVSLFLIDKNFKISNLSLTLFKSFLIFSILIKNIISGHDSIESMSSDLTWILFSSKKFETIAHSSLDLNKIAMSFRLKFWSNFFSIMFNMLWRVDDLYSSFVLLSINETETCPIFDFVCFWWKELNVWWTWSILILSIKNEKKLLLNSTIDFELLKFLSRE